MEFNEDNDEDFVHSSPESDDSELWLVSYADLMTLIACFFILMLSFANFEPKSFARKTREVSKSMTKDKGPDVQLDQVEQLKSEIEKSELMQGKVEAKINDRGLMLTFSSNALFTSGSSELLPEALPALDVMIKLIQKKNPKFRILVEGHTDSEPTRKGGLIKSNWELSSSRAAQVIYRFESQGFKPNRMVSIGYGQTRPLAPDFNKGGSKNLANMQKNRRVVIKILEPRSDSKNVKLGLGVYFNEFDSDL